MVYSKKTIYLSNKIIWYKFKIKHKHFRFEIFLPKILSLNYATMETYYSAKERRAQILQLLKSSPKILVSSLSQMFNISELLSEKI